MDPITTRTAKIWLAEDGIIHLRPLASREQALADAMENVAAVAMAGAGAILPLLIHFQKAAPQTPECRAYYTSREANRNVSAVAIVTGSMLGRVIGNLMIGMSNNAVNLRLFDDEERALRWLKESHAETRPSPAAPP